MTDNAKELLVPMTSVREALEEVRAFMKVDIGNGDSDLWTAEYRALWDTVNEALSAAPGEPCAVKPLEWRDHRPDSFPEPAWSAQTPFGFYNIEEVSASDSPAYVVRLHAHHFVADKYGLDEAKAAAQADYEQRIRSALVTTPQPAAGWDDLPKRPFAFAVKRASENGEDQWRLFMSEADARAEAEQLDGDYEGLYRVGDRRSALTTPQPAAGWTCLARKQSLPEPAECNWPDCGCDPHATKVIESLVEQGWTAPREALAPAEDSYRNAIDEALVVRHLGIAKGDAKAELDQIINWEVDVALDPAVSERARQLTTSPDTAETRLREALTSLHEAILTLSKFGKNNVTLFEDSLLENQECFDAWLRLNTAQTKAAEVLGPPFKLRFSSGWLASKIKSDPDIETDAGKAISPPSGGDDIDSLTGTADDQGLFASLGGDEAKESEGLCTVPPGKNEPVTTQTACDEGESNDSATARRMPGSESTGSLASAIATTQCEDRASPGSSGHNPTHGCKRAGGFVNSSCTALCDCHETQKLSRPSEPSPPADRRDEPSGLRTLRHLLAHMPDKDFRLSRRDAKHLLQFIDAILAALAVDGLALVPVAGRTTLPALIPDRSSASGYRVEHLSIEVDAELAAALTAASGGEVG